MVQDADIEVTADELDEIREAQEAEARAAHFAEFDAQRELDAWNTAQMLLPQPTWNGDEPPF